MLNIINKLLETTTNVIKNKQHLFNTTFLNNDSKQK